jgi:hypothetical protein
MRHSINSNTGKNTYGVFKESLNSSEYIYNKKAKTIYCKANICIPNKNIDTQNNLLLLKRSNNLNYNTYSKFNTSNLNINLYSKLDLNDIPVIRNNNTPFESPSTINTTTIPYLNYEIDPSGNLFGNSICGVLNFENYLLIDT